MKRNLETDSTGP